MNRSVRLRPLLAFLSLLAAFGSVRADDEPAKKDAPKSDPAVLTVERIFDSKDFEFDKVPAPRWQKKGSGYLTLEKTPHGQELVRHDPATGKKETLVPDHWLIPAGDVKPLAVEGFELSDDGARLLIYTNSRRVWRTNSRGDYWLLDMTTRELKKLGGWAGPSTMMFATFSPDGSRIAYVHRNNIYVQDAVDLKITQLTQDGSDTLVNGNFDWVYEEELHLQRGYRWSPDSKKIAYWQLDSSGVKEFFITASDDGPYSHVVSIRYPKTGEKNSAARIGVVDATGGTTKWLRIAGDPREHYLAKMEWIDADRLAVQRFNRLQNENLVMVFDPKTGDGQTILVEKDAAWVENNNDFRWIDGGKKLVWLSERDGWRHLHLANDSHVIRPAGGEIDPPRITKGNFDVIRIQAIDEKNGIIYFDASPDNPTQSYLYRASLKGGEGDVQRVTPADQPGTHSYSISADAQWAVHTHSRFGKPPVTTLVHLPDHKVVKTFADNVALQKKLDSLKLGPSEMFRVAIDDKTTLDGWCLKPPGFDPTKKYPVLFYVYGEPAGQTVLDRWDDKKFLWHSMLAQQGFLVMSIDNRGTPAPRGREWRRCVYRQVGILAPADQAAAVRTLLRERPYIDPARVAIWGWSGGGSMTLNAIFKYPDLYRTAMAVAPVPNQRHYDTIYQERYMGMPADNVDGYRNGSPIHFAKDLKGNLLVVHGTGDDNCHYHGVEALVDELVIRNKPFAMLAYPNRTHAIKEGRNTTRHLFESLTRYLKEHTPAP